MVEIKSRPFKMIDKGTTTTTTRLSRPHLLETTEIKSNLNDFDKNMPSKLNVTY